MATQGTPPAYHIGVGVGLPHGGAQSRATGGLNPRGGALKFLLRQGGATGPLHLYHDQ